VSKRKKAAKRAIRKKYISEVPFVLRCSLSIMRGFALTLESAFRYDSETLPALEKDENVRAGRADSGRFCRRP
jgi:hypothetical protein